jgi:hypothetical protein
MENNSRKAFNFWQKWLTYANLFALIVGLAAALANETIVFKIYNEYLWESFGMEESAEEFRPFKKWVFGILGATIVGFHLLVICICENAFKKRERWAYVAILAAISIWFFIDSAITIYYAAWFNLFIINIPAYTMIMLPLVFTWGCFFDRDGRSTNPSARHPPVAAD